MRQPARSLRATVLLAIVAGLISMTTPITGAGSVTIWPTTATPQSVDSDNTAVEVGVRFRSDVAGTVSGVRYYKYSSNTGTHIGNLWTNGGTKLATATFTGETTSGWQQVTFASPVTIAAGTTYVASYHTNAGHYGATGSYFATTGFDRAPLHALKNGVDGPNGVYRYGSASAFPDQTFGSANYWVDVVFTASAPDTTAPTVTSQAPANNATGVGVSSIVTATFSEAVTASTLNTSTFELRDSGAALVAAAVSYNAASLTATLDPTANLAYATTYTATVKTGVTDVAGNAMTSAVTWSFTTSATPPPPPPPPTCPCSIWNPATTTPTNDETDANPVELGVRFQADTAGYVTGVRFYKFADNTGVHVGNLWTTSGALLARATFSGETAAGWQQVTFAPPVAVAAHTTYVASYHTDAGHYATNMGFFSAGVDNAPLHALQDGGDGPNGIYRYGTTSFPDQTYHSANYWVDAVFSTTPGSDVTPPTVSQITPANGATGVITTTVVTATFNEMPAPSTVNPTTFQLRDGLGALVAATAYAGGETPTSTLIPSSALAPGTTYTATVKGGSGGVKDLAGNAMVSDYSWSFTTAGTPPPPGTCPCNIWSPTTTPAIADSDASAVEVGVRFRSDTSGYISGLRFYKTSANTGTHIGNLWTNTGTRLATATFTGESSAGWQQVSLLTPVAITANTTYVVSYHTDTGHYAVNGSYFTSAVDNAPLHALRDGVDGPNGVYHYGATSSFPDQTYQSANYWADVVFTTIPGGDSTVPHVVDVSPSAGAANVPVNQVIGANINENMIIASINTTTFELRGPGGALVPGSVQSFQGESGFMVASLFPATALAYSTSYTATLKGGTNGIKDMAGNPMSADYVWSFTTVTAPPPPGTCPCSLWNNTTTPAGMGIDAGSVELGVKFQSSIAGYITGLRFYKYANNVGPHVGELWSGNGTIMAAVTFTNETASGWQQATLSPAVAISPNITYVASYHTNSGYYAVNASYFSSAFTNTPLRALADSEGGNGVYRYGPSGSFPNQTYQASNYWVDPVFATSLPDNTAPTLTSWGPVFGGTPISVNGTLSFSEHMDPASINTSTFEMHDPSGAVVPAVVTYNDLLYSATLDPLGTLAYSTTYSMIVRGGTSGPRIMDLAGNAMAANASWTFNTVAAPTPTQGPGGPILVVTGASSPYSRYYAEILRAEGLNLFDVADLSSVSASTLGRYDVAILGEMPVTAAQATMFSDWVNGGGNLIAMRPDTTLATLLGLGTKSASTLANGYLLVDGSTAPGAGVVADTLQFHGTSDEYAVGGAATVATLYSDAVTATAYPAVTLNSVGTNGGEAAAFTFDLARSIVYARQGDATLAVQDRDGVAPITPADLLFGATNAARLAIPQADEQQRLLVNLVLQMNRNRKPLPRFWYFPRGTKAVVVMTGEKHLSDAGEAARLDGYKAASAPGCSVANWECIRATAYLASDTTTIGNAAAAGYQTDGFELGAQIDTGCANWTALSLPTTYSDQLTAFAAAFPGLQAQKTHRTRCSVWSDYATQPTVELGRGIRLDTNYSGLSFFTGSGMPMRFADSSGGLIDVYQAATQRDATLGETDPAVVDALLTKALGPEGYYGAFTANMQADLAFSAGSDQIVASAKTRGVPVISARQLLDWVDARNASSFQAMTWAGGTLTFSIAIGTNANGLQAMLPGTVTAGSLVTLTLNGSPVAFTRQTIKGIEYVLFQAAAGTYRATYTP